MNCAKKALMVILVTALAGLWGCTQSTGPGASSARLRELEARAARLEDDVKTATAARDQARKKVTVLEEQRAQLAQQVDNLQNLVRERDDLKQLVTTRTTERDALQASLIQFSRDLQNLATKIDQAAQAHGATPPAVTGTAPAAVTTETKS